MASIHIIIPAGGAGTRLWPLSRRNRPKFLLDVMGSGRSLLQQTALRLAPLAETLTVVTGVGHRQAVQRQLDELNLGFPVQVLVEPSGRDSMAAIGYAAYVIREKYGESAVAGSFAADHVITEETLFCAAVQAGAAAAAQGEFLVTLGMSPTYPSTAYGYIQPALTSDSNAVSSVDPNLDAISVVPARRFVEKPAAAEAGEYLQAGYLWNAGIFLFQTGTLAEMLQRNLPQMDEGLTRLLSLSPTGLSTGLPTNSSASLSTSSVISPEFVAAWEQLPKIAIDHALAEPEAASGHVAVVETPPIGWTDVGDYRALSDLLRQGQHREAAAMPPADSSPLSTGGEDGAAGSEPLWVDCRPGLSFSVSSGGSLSSVEPATFGAPLTGAPATADELTNTGGASGSPIAFSSAASVALTRAKKIVVLGIDDAVVVDADNVVFVTRLDQAQQVKKVVETLRETGQEDLL